MKFYRHPSYRRPPVMKKALMIMKCIIVLFFSTLMSVSAASLAQQVTISVKNAPLEQVLDQFRQQSGYNIVYSSDVLDKAGRITIDLKNTNIEDALKQALAGQPLLYEIDGKTILIKEKQEVTILDKLKSALNLDKIDVTGRVLDENGAPLAAATVSVKDGKVSTITDIQGLFTLKDVYPNATIIITNIGYDKKELKANPNLGIIKMTPATSKLDEVVVEAYGQTSQRLSLGDITTVSAKSIGNQPVNNPLLALQGQVPGLEITPSTFLPGSGITVLIQGQNSVQAGSDPLYVIDGVPYPSQMISGIPDILGGTGATGQRNSGNPLSYINPHDIESISILKDGDATSLYGSRAANGAIIITTKKGKPGQTQVNFNLENGWGTVPKFLILMNTSQYLQLRHEAFKNDGLTPSADPADPNYAPDLLMWDTTRNTNWQKVLFGNTAHYTNYDASISGGSEQTQFLVSSTYHRETSILPGDFANESKSVHFNLNSTSLNQKFHFNLLGSYSLNNNRLPSGISYTDIYTAPDAPPLYNTNGTLNYAPNSAGTSTFANPLGPYLYASPQLQVDNLVASGFLSYQLIKGLVVKLNMGYTNMQQNGYQPFPLIQYLPEYRQYIQRSANYSNGYNNSWLIEPQLHYQRQLGKGKFEALFGGSANQNNNNSQILRGVGYSSDAILQNPSAATNLYSNGTTASQYRYVALLARLNYNWDDRYLFEMTGNRDGSSRFGSENEFADFWSVAGGWLFSNEKFVTNNLSWLSFGKLRTSYGTSGNDQIGDYKFLSSYYPVSQPSPYQGTSGLIVGGIANPFLKWERTNKLEASLDLGFINDRILLSATFYRNRTSNLLLNYNLPVQTGFTFITENLPATIQNGGEEFTLNTLNIKSNNFSWSTSVNLTVPDNKLISFPGIAQSSLSNLTIGQPFYGTIKVFRFAGMDKSTGQYQFYTKDGSITGNPQYVTDQTETVNLNPKFYGGITNTFRYKKIEFSFLFYFKKITGPSSLATLINGLPGYIGSPNQPTAVLNRWQHPGDNAPYQLYTTQNFNVYNLYGYLGNSNAGYSDDSYLRLQNLNISWEVPAFWVNRLGLKAARLFTHAENLFTITGYKGLDPTSFGGLATMRVVTLGIHASF